MTTNKPDADKENQTPSSGNGEDKTNVFYNSPFQRDCRALRAKGEQILEELYADLRTIKVKMIRGKVERTRKSLHRELKG